MRACGFVPYLNLASGRGFAIGQNPNILQKSQEKLQTIHGIVIGADEEDVKVVL
jgi:hypothetical protein